MELIRAENLQLPERLHAMDLRVYPGEMIGIIGPNGAGKSTLLQVLAGLIPAAGNLFWQDQPVTNLTDAARLRAYLPQQLQLQWDLRVEDAVNLGRAPFNFTGLDCVEAALEACDLISKRKKSVLQLSGGEQARVHLARALATQAPLLLADEPLASLDFLYQKQILTRLRAYANAERAVIISIHDLSMAARFCDRLVLLKDGHLLKVGAPEEVLTEALLSQAYGVAVAVDLTATPPLIAVK